MSTRMNGLVAEVKIAGGYGAVGKKVTQNLLRWGMANRLPGDLALGNLTQRDLVAASVLGVVGNRVPDVRSAVGQLEVDSVHGSFEDEITVGAVARPGKPLEQYLEANGVRIYYDQQPNLGKIPWRTKDIPRILIDCSGKVKDAGKDVIPVLRRMGNESGAEIVICSTTLKGGSNHVIGTPLEPGMDPVIHAILKGDNVGLRAAYGSGSCTTNAVLVPSFALSEFVTLDELVSLETIHGYTGSQGLMDQVNLEAGERGRAAALSTVPTSTNAKELANVAPGLFGRIREALAYRVPVAEGSIVNLVVRCTPPGLEAVYQDRDQ